MAPTPDTARGWLRVVADAAAIGLLIWEGVFVTDPSLLIVGASLTLLGAAKADKIDEVLKRWRDSRTEGDS